MFIVDPIGRVWPEGTEKIPPEFVIAAFKLLFFFISIYQFALGPTAPLPFDPLEWLFVSVLRLNNPNYIKPAPKAKSIVSVTKSDKKKENPNTEGKAKKNK